LGVSELSVGKRPDKLMLLPLIKIEEKNLSGKSFFFWPTYFQHANHIPRGKNPVKRP
jgi:hypothetical protein